MEADNLPDRKLRTRILSVIVLTMLAVPITLLTSLWAPYSMYESGFPFSWETRGCVAILNPLGGFGCTPISYNWWAFVVDVLFYAAVGCGLLFAYANYHEGKRALILPNKPEQSSMPVNALFLGRLVPAHAIVGIGICYSVMVRLLST